MRITRRNLCRKPRTVSVTAHKIASHQTKHKNTRTDTDVRVKVAKVAVTTARLHVNYRKQGVQVNNRVPPGICCRASRRDLYVFFVV
jgi:hypothetical protein